MEEKELETNNSEFSEKEIKTVNKKNTSNIGADASLLTFSKIATSAIALVMSMVLARSHYTDADKAVYKEILMIVNLVSSFIMLGLPKSLNFFLARTESMEEKRRFLSFYYTLNTILSFFVGFVLVVSVIFIDPQGMGKYLYFLALFPWTKIVCASIENLLIVYKKAKYLVAFRILNSASLLISLAIAVLLNWEFGYYMLAYVLVETGFAVAVYILASKFAGGIRPYISKKMLKTVLAFSIPLGLASVVGTLNIELDKFIIRCFMDDKNFQTYTFVATELPVTMIASSFTAVLLPQMVRMLSKNDTKKALKLWGNATTLSMMIISIVSVGCFVYCGDVVNILYGPDYVYGKWVFGLYSLYLILRSTYYGMVLNSVGKTTFIFWSSIGTLISNAVLNVVFFVVMRWLFGETAAMMSPALATLCSSIIMSIIQLTATAKYLKVGLRDVFPWFNAAKVLLLNAAFGAVFVVLKMILPLEKYLAVASESGLDGSAVESLSLAVVWGILYFGLMLKPIKRKWNSLKVKNND